MKEQAMKATLENNITDFVREYDEGLGALAGTLWRAPLVGYADAAHPYILRLPEIVQATHALPTDVLIDARIVICCFVPFTRAVALSNKSAEDLASPEWAQAYEYTNAMLLKLNEVIIETLTKHGYVGKVAPESAVFDNSALKSNWSHRHFAYAAGLGTFGLNNMLITRAGCCGRLTSVVTDLDVEPDSIMEDELCLYKQSGKCGVCVKHCPTGALAQESYDRVKCYAQCLKNAKIHTAFGSSYLTSEGVANAVGSEVCGKCVTYSPCTYREI